MEWDVQLSEGQRAQMVLICARVRLVMSTLAAQMREHGVFTLYRATHPLAEDARVGVGGGRRFRGVDGSGGGGHGGGGDDDSIIGAGIGRRAGDGCEEWRGACAVRVARPWPQRLARREHSGSSLLCSEGLASGRSDAELVAAMAADGCADVSRDDMLQCTFELLQHLRAVRASVRSRTIPADLVAPSTIFVRHCMKVIFLLATLAYAVSALRSTQTRKEAAAAAVDFYNDFRRWMGTHVNEPIRGIAREFSHDYPPVIELEQVQATRQSLVRALTEFAAAVHKESEPAAREAAMAAAAAGSMNDVTSVFEDGVRAPISNMMRGELLRAMLLQVQQLKLLMEEQVAAIDRILARNDLSLQLMAIVPAAALAVALSYVVRRLWCLLRASPRGPIDDLRSELITIEGMLTRAAGRLPAGSHTLTQYEASPMDVAEAGDVVFRVQRLRSKGAHWLRGWLRNDVLHGLHELLDSGRLDATQRAQIASALLRRLGNVNALFHHW